MMLNMSWEDFWWNNITGARTVVNRVSMALLENKMVMLKVPSDLPWRYAMRSAIQTSFSNRTDLREVVIEIIDEADQNPDNMEPGRFILRNYASRAVEAGYREKSRTSIQEYISDKNVIRNRIIWMKGLEKGTAAQWVRFCRGFSPRNVIDGLFVLEVHDKVTASELRSMEYIDFDDCVSSYDVQQFNSFILDEQGLYTTEWKQYISAVAAIVCGADAETSEMLLKIVDFQTETAIEGLQRICEMGEFERRGGAAFSDHPLWHLRQNNTDELLHRIWTAQIRILFPIIELERQKLIEKLGPEIEKALERDEVTQFGTILTDPKEIELGTLCFMMNKTHGDYRMLYVPEESDRMRIRFLHNCRNKLAHMNCCTPDEIAALLN